MRFQGFIGPSYKLASANVDAQRCINLFPEMNETGTGKEREVAWLRSTPGLRLLNTLGAGPIRGVFTSSVGRTFAVSQNKLYELDADFNSTGIGELDTSAGPVSMADSGRYLAVVDGGKTGLLVKFQDSSVAQIPFPSDINGQAFEGCTQVAFQDGYFIYHNIGTSDFFISGLAKSSVADETTIDPLDANTSEGSPDPVTAIISDHRELWIFNARTIEIYFNAAQEGQFPFQRNEGAFIEQGTEAPFSVQKMKNAVYWLGSDDKGSGMIYRATGFQPERISTHAVESAIQTYGNLKDAVAYTYQEDGHFFYVINFPSANSTWAFDTATSLWHERVFTKQGQFERHRADSHAFAFGKHVVGDYADGRIYELTNAVFTDDGDEITRRRVAPHITSSLNWVFYNSIQIDMETGVGLDGLGQGTDPKLMLRFSDDGAHTWSNEKWTSIGRIGNKRHRSMFRRLGRSRDRVFEITYTDPTPFSLIGAELSVQMGAN